MLPYCRCLISGYHPFFKPLPLLKGLPATMPVNFDLNDLYAFRAFMGWQTHCRDQS
jgi:hypothetical protein